MADKKKKYVITRKSHTIDGEEKVKGDEIMLTDSQAAAIADRVALATSGKAKDAKEETTPDKK